MTDTEPSDLPGQVVDVTPEDNEVLENEDNKIKETDTNNDISDTPALNELEETEEKQDDMDATISGKTNDIEDNENDMDEPEEVDDDMD